MPDTFCTSTHLRTNKRDRCQDYSHLFENERLRSPVVDTACFFLPRGFSGPAWKWPSQDLSPSRWSFKVHALNLSTLTCFQTSLTTQCSEINSLYTLPTSCLSVHWRKIFTSIHSLTLGNWPQSCNSLYLHTDTQWHRSFLPLWSSFPLFTKATVWFNRDMNLSLLPSLAVFAEWPWYSLPYLDGGLWNRLSNVLQA